MTTIPKFLVFKEQFVTPPLHDYLNPIYFVDAPHKTHMDIIEFMCAQSPLPVQAAVLAPPACSIRRVQPPPSQS